MLIHLSECFNVVKNYFAMGSWCINNQDFFKKYSNATGVQAGQLTNCLLLIIAIENRWDYDTSENCI